MEGRKTNPLSQGLEIKKIKETKRTKTETSTAGTIARTIAKTDRVVKGETMRILCAKKGLKSTTTLILDNST
jgi:hypothetical protein